VSVGYYAFGFVDYNPLAVHFLATIRDLKFNSIFC